MKHDLDSINAAIRLGDNVIPPIGCKIKWFNTVYEYNITGVVKIVFHYKCKIKEYGGDFSFYDPRYDSNLEILGIPDGTIPFEKWDRYNET